MLHVYRQCMGENGSSALFYLSSITAQNPFVKHFFKNNPILYSEIYNILLIDGIRFLLYDKEYLQVALFGF